MRIDISIDTTDLNWIHDRKQILKVFEAWKKLFDDHEKKPVKADPKEEKAALDTVKEIIKEPTPKPKKSEAKHQQDIQAIKDAVKQQKELKGGGKDNMRADIDDSLIIYMRDEQGMSLKTIAKELRCCEQTVLNRYNKAKGKKS